MVLPSLVSPCTCQHLHLGWPFPGKLGRINGIATYLLQKKRFLLSSVVRLGGQAHLLVSEYFKHTLGKT